MMQLSPTVAPGSLLELGSPFLEHRTLLDTASGSQRSRLGVRGGGGCLFHLAHMRRPSHLALGLLYGQHNASE